MKKIGAYTALTLLMAFMLVSCSDSVNSNGNGRLKLYLIDAPASLDSVVINVLRVEVNSNGDTWTVINDVPAHYDLLQLSNGASAVLGDKSLPSGTYTQIRLILGDDNYVCVNGVRHALKVPSGEQTGLKLIHEFTIEPDNLYELYLDFNAARSVNMTGAGNYMLKPTVRVQAVVVSGTISGIVQPPDADAVVWTTSGSDTVSAFPDTTGYFKLMCLPQGTYDVHVDPSDTAYQPVVISGVIVSPQQNTDLGTITLQSK